MENLNYVLIVFQNHQWNMTKIKKYSIYKKLLIKKLVVFLFERRFKMSLIDIMKNKKKVSTRQFINTKDISEYGLKTYKGGSLVYIVIKPSNLSVLASDKITNKVTNLMVVFSEIEELEIVCMSSREKFDDNNLNIDNLLAKEKNEHIRSLLEKDKHFFERVQIQTASAREFFIVLRFQDDKEKEAGSMGEQFVKQTTSRYQTTNRVLKLLNEQGFDARLSKKADIKKMLAVYFVQNVTQVYFEDYNGSRFLMDNEDYF